jgi:hypothetical protein
MNTEQDLIPLNEQGVEVEQRDHNRQPESTIDPTGVGGDKATNLKLDKLAKGEQNHE